MGGAGNRGGRHLRVRHAEQRADTRLQQPRIGEHELGSLVRATWAARARRAVRVAAAWRRAVAVAAAAAGVAEAEAGDEPLPPSTRNVRSRENSDEFRTPITLDCRASGSGCSVVLVLLLLRSTGAFAATPTRHSRRPRTPRARSWPPSRRTTARRFARCSGFGPTLRSLGRSRGRRKASRSASSTAYEAKHSFVARRRRREAH